MFGIWKFVKRNWESASPKEVPKLDGALKIGLFGASKIAPSAIIAPARTHPDVIISAIAARDEPKARSYAKKHGIPIVHISYQAILDDPSIDAVYIPLPNGLHYEWAVKVLKANKRILLEKPSTSNQVEAESLFRLPLLNEPSAPVLLEAFHSVFHPSWQRFLSLLDRENITHVTATLRISKGIIAIDDIRYKFDLAGRAMMDFGTYGVALLRQIFASEPTECVELATHRCRLAAIPISMLSGAFPMAVLQNWKQNFGPLAAGASPCSLMKKPPQKDRHIFERGKVVFWNFVLPGLYHRLDIHDTHKIQNTSDNKALKTWTESSYIKVYSQEHSAGTDSSVWSTYRCMLEEFVNRIRGRHGLGIRWDGENSIKQMKVIDDTYKKMGLPVRPTSKYL